MHTQSLADTDMRRTVAFDSLSGAFILKMKLNYDW